MSWIAVAVGTAVSGAKAISDNNKKDSDNKIDAKRQEMAPWTKNYSPYAITQSDPMGTMLKGIGSGALFGAGLNASSDGKNGFTGAPSPLVSTGPAGMQSGLQQGAGAPNFYSTDHLWASPYRR
jgi:hypothetical protein